MPLYFTADELARMERRAAKFKAENARPACPDCHTIHTVPKTIVGHHLWDVCPVCLRKIDEQTRRTLADRGIVLA